MMKMSVFLRVLCVATPLVMAVAGMRSLILADWWLENLVVMVFFLVLALTHRRLPLSNSAYLLLFAFLCLHEYGAAYSYSNVPFGDALMPWLGGSRNHYDRLIHFLFGLMLAVPVYEAMSMITRQRGAVAHLFTVQFVLAASASTKSWSGPSP